VVGNNQEDDIQDLLEEQKRREEEDGSDMGSEDHDDIAMSDEDIQVEDSDSDED